MRYWLDTEFIENGKTIDLLSIGIVAEDGREFYAQMIPADETIERASDWVARNVLLHLGHFDMGTRRRACEQAHWNRDVATPARCRKDDCPWMFRQELADAIKDFCDPEKYGKPQFWGYYADYDWVVLCQLFGSMMDLPKGWPMFCMDIKQLCVEKGDPRLPEQGKGEHHALADARWNLKAWEFLQGSADAA